MKYEEKGGVKLTPSPGETTFKKPSLIRVNVWKIFRMKIMKAYMIESFRKESIIFFQLDPTYYLSTSGYSSDPMLMFTDVNLKLVSDV